MDYAILSGSNEQITNIEVERFLITFLRKVNNSNKINDFYSFRCPICYLPISFVRRSVDKKSYFKHIGGEKNRNCPYYIGNMGKYSDDIDHNQIINIKNPSDLILKILNFKLINRWYYFNELDQKGIFPNYFKKISYLSSEFYVFFWVFPIINFLENLANHNFIIEMNNLIDKLYEHWPKNINIVYLYYKNIEDFAQFKECEVFKYFKKMKDINIDYIIESNIKPSYIFPNNRIWKYFKEQDELKTYSQIPIYILNRYNFSYKIFESKINPYIKNPLKEGIYIGYFDRKGTCQRCHNPIHLVLSLPYKAKKYFNIHKYKGLNYVKSRNQFRCRACLKELFSIDKWLEVLKKNIKFSRQIDVGDKIEFIFGDYQGKRGIVLFKEHQDLIINVLMESKQEIKQSIFFAKKIKDL